MNAPGSRTHLSRGSQLQLAVLYQVEMGRGVATFEGGGGGLADIVAKA